MCSIALAPREVNMLSFKWILSMNWDPRVVNMLKFNFVLFQLVLRLANMMRSYEDVILFGAREWSTCSHPTHVFYCLGFESGQHVESL